jgi:transcription initiation factor TFIIH subunit 3
MDQLRSKFLYPTLHGQTHGSSQQTEKDANVYQNFKVVNDAVLSGIGKLLSDHRPTLEEKELGSSKIAASLSLGLCCKEWQPATDIHGYIPVGSQNLDFII